MEKVGAWQTPNTRCQNGAPGARNFTQCYQATPCSWNSSWRCQMPLFGRGGSMVGIHRLNVPAIDTFSHQSRGSAQMHVFPSWLACSTAVCTFACTGPNFRNHGGTHRAACAYNLRSFGPLEINSKLRPRSVLMCTKTNMHVSPVLNAGEKVSAQSDALLWPNCP